MKNKEIVDVLKTEVIIGLARKTNQIVSLGTFLQMLEMMYAITLGLVSTKKYFSSEIRAFGIQETKDW